MFKAPSNRHCQQHNTQIFIGRIMDTGTLELHPNYQGSVSQAGWSQSFTFTKATSHWEANWRT